MRTVKFSNLCHPRKIQVRASSRARVHSINLLTDSLKSRPQSCHLLISMKLANIAEPARTHLLRQGKPQPLASTPILTLSSSRTQNRKSAWTRNPLTCRSFQAAWCARCHEQTPPALQRLPGMHTIVWDRKQEASNTRKQVRSSMLRLISWTKAAKLLSKMAPSS